MPLLEWMRLIPTPKYGHCGGADADCAVKNLDPLDALFFKHDNDLRDSEEINAPGEKLIARDRADADLGNGLMNLSKDDFKKIPIFTLRPPFLKRAYASLYRQAALKIFKPK